MEGTGKTNKAQKDGRAKVQRNSRAREARDKKSGTDWSCAYDRGSCHVTGRGNQSAPVSWHQIQYALVAHGPALSACASHWAQKNMFPGARDLQLCYNEARVCATVRRAKQRVYISVLLQQRNTLLHNPLVSFAFCPFWKLKLFVIVIKRVWLTALCLEQHPASVVHDCLPTYVSFVTCCRQRWTNLSNLLPVTSGGMSILLLTEFFYSPWSVFHFVADKNCACCFTTIFMCFLTAKLVPFCPMIKLCNSVVNSVTVL